jgi:hypothetical protein
MQLRNPMWCDLIYKFFMMASEEELMHARLAAVCTFRVGMLLMVAQFALTHAALALDGGWDGSRTGDRSRSSKDTLTNDESDQAMPTR